MPRLSLLVLAVVFMANPRAMSQGADPYRVDVDLMQLTFSDMLTFGMVDGSGSPPEAVPQRRRNQSAKLYILGREAQSRGERGEAARLYRMAAGQDPSNAAAWEELGDLQFQIGRHHLAVDAWSRALLSEENSQLLMKCGMLESELGLHDRAAEHLLRRRLLLDGSLPVDQETVVQDVTLRRCLRRLGNVDLVRSLDREIDSLLREMASRSLSTPEAGKQWMQMVQDLFLGGDPEAARAASASRLLYGPLEGQYGPWIAANLKTRYVLLDAVLGGDGRSTVDLLEHLDAIGMLRGLPPDWRKPTTLATVLYEAGVDYASLGNQAAANQLLAEVLIHDPGHILARNNLGYAALERGSITPVMVEMIDAALADARQREADSLPQVLDTAAWLRYMQGHLVSDEHASGAIELLREAVDRLEDPDPVIFDHLGDASWLAGRREEAVDAWMEALRRLNDPDFKQGMFRNLDMLQGMIWQFPVVESSEMYDREYGVLLRRLVEKLTAVEQGESPSVAERILFIK
tara:strand:+ start:93 stop:1646 length:1554 start_codon:yes stop_codon:yes gene_type:complete